MHHSSTRQSAYVFFFFHLCIHTYIQMLHIHATFYSAAHLANGLEQKFKSIQGCAATLKLVEIRLRSDIHILHLFMCLNHSVLFPAVKGTSVTG